MNSYAIFTDVSVNTKLKVGVGVCLIVPKSLTEASLNDIRKDNIVKHLVTQKFTETSSTKLEVQTILWALEIFQKEFKKASLDQLYIFTDSQCVAGLLKRRGKLESNDFLSKKTGDLLKNASLYQKFYKLYDDMNFEVIKVTGHSKPNTHDTVHRIFSFVDKAARKGVKKEYC
jgi:ribonuclease HI